MPGDSPDLASTTSTLGDGGSVAPASAIDRAVAGLARRPAVKRVVSPDGSRRQRIIRSGANQVRAARARRSAGDPGAAEPGLAHDSHDASAAPQLDPLEALRARDPWFHSHYVEAVDVVRDFVGGDGLSLHGATVADIGCGHGLTDLGFVERLGAAHVVGFDIEPVDEERLARTARDLLGWPSLPPSLEFRTCGPTHLPADDDTFDWVVSWSAFEHIEDPLAVCREIRRVLRPDGKFFVQLYPFFHSPWGSHLDAWFPEPFVQHRLDDERIRAHVLGHPVDGRPGKAEKMWEAYRTLNRITLDDLQDAIRGAGFRIDKAQLYTGCTHLPPESQHVPLSSLMISGVILLAQPLPTAGE